jgi:hypothetical protein
LALGTNIKDINALKTMKNISYRTEYFKKQKQTVTSRSATGSARLANINQKRFSKLNVFRARVTTEDHQDYI